MNKNEKFEVAKKKLLEENESKYGTEIREKYGDDIVDASNSKLMELNTRQFERVQQLSDQINEQLKAACKQGNPSSEFAQQVCALHKEWLGFFGEITQKKRTWVWHRCTWMTPASRYITMQ